MAISEERRTMVAEWRASGRTAEEFGKERGVPTATLWAWSSRMRKEERRASGGDEVQLARVERKHAENVSTAVTIELRGVRILVGRGADKAMVMAALEAVTALHRGEVGRP